MSRNVFKENWSEGRTMTQNMSKSAISRQNMMMAYLGNIQFHEAVKASWVIIYTDLSNDGLNLKVMATFSHPCTS